MRLSTQQIFLTSLNGVLNGQSKLVDLQQQISSGKKIETPADDPIASSQVIAVNQHISLTQQYSNNASLAEGRLHFEESALNSIEDVLQRVRQLTVQAGDGALALQDRKAISVEIKQRLEQLVNLANSRDSNDQFIFGGFQSGQSPITKGSTGGYNYQGDEGQLFIKVADNTNVAVSDSGKSLFMDIDEPLNFSATPNGGNTGAVIVSDQAVLNQKSFESFHPDGATITFDTTGPITTYTVTRISDGGVISGGDPAAPLSNVPYVAGEALTFEGMHIELSGAPANGDSVNVTSLVATKLDVFSAIEKLAIGLEGSSATPLTQLGLSELVADSLISLDSALDNVLQTEAQIGSRLNVIDDAVAVNENIKLIGQQTLSDLEDIDYADVLSKLSLQSFILEATQSSFVKITNLSLFNFLR